MNYRHEFHAGNHADVFKHAVLVRILLYLARKPAPFRVIDTHAGSGTYNLGGAAAARTGEWRAGIGRVDPATMERRARDLLAPYLAIVGAAREGRAPYPGSPLITQALMRPFDRLIACETRPETRLVLEKALGKDARAKVIELDGYVALNAFVPPVERRGLVLIDPPFEAADEFDRLAEALVGAQKKWAGGTYVAWYPVKDRRGPERLAAALVGAGIEDALRLELVVGPRGGDGPLAASGLLVVNPPYVLAEEAACLLAALARQLGAGRGSSLVERLGAA